MTFAAQLGSVELITWAALAIAAVGCIYLGTRRGTRAVLGVLLAGGAMALLATGGVRTAEEVRPPEDRPEEWPAAGSARPDDEHTGSHVCRSCHVQQWHTWHASHHRTMTQVPTATNVVGRFDGVPRRAFGRTYRMLQRGDAYFVELPDPAHEGAVETAARVTRPVVMMTGAHHQQIYWVASGRKRQPLLIPLVWVREPGRWVPLSDIFIEPPPAPGEATQVPRAGLWNNNCAHCHSTHPRAMEGDAEVAEFGIACEACHGPARAHVARHRAPWARYVAHLDDKADPTIAHLGRLSPHRASEVCGQCHGESQPNEAGKRARAASGPSFRPGDRLADHMQPPKPPGTRLRPGETKAQINSNFWRDGGVRVAGREYTAMVRSGCYRRGELSCLSCHSMHGPEEGAAPSEAWRDDQLKTGHRGDVACTGCHQALANAGSAHTNHSPDSPGSRCQNCHMPNTAWSLLKATRDHEVSSPDLALDRRVGRPNACNLCHLDKPERWAAAALAKAWNRPTPDLAAFDGENAAGAVWLLRGDAGVRALAAWHFAWGPAKETAGSAWMTPLLLLALDDPYVAVRQTALKALELGARPDGYDALGDVGKRAIAVSRAMLRWQASHAIEGSPRFAPEAVPLLPGGRLDVPRADRLRRGRDERPIALRE